MVVGRASEGGRKEVDRSRPLKSARRRRSTVRSVLHEPNAELAAAARLVDRPDDENVEVDRRALGKELDGTTRAAHGNVAIRVQAEPTQAHVDDRMRLARPATVAPGDDDPGWKRRAFRTPALGTALSRSASAGIDGFRSGIAGRGRGRGWHVGEAHLMKRFKGETRDY